jgi:aerobic-type carbon monoxide dehydrogenase small subunit (CoxS/CutS family)
MPGKTITVDGSKFSGTQTVKIYANGKHIQTITIVKG